MSKKVCNFAIGFNREGKHKDVERHVFETFMK